jgi:hypothetical protein
MLSCASVLRRIMRDKTAAFLCLGFSPNKKATHTNVREPPVCVRQDNDKIANQDITPTPLVWLYPTPLKFPLFPIPYSLFPIPYSLFPKSIESLIRLTPSQSLNSTASHLISRSVRSCPVLRILTGSIWRNSSIRLTLGVFRSTC